MGLWVSLTAAVLVWGAVLFSSSQQVHGASFYGESYIVLRNVESFSKFSLQLSFRTYKPYGLLFLAAGKTEYCLVELLLGRVQVKINFGEGEHVLLIEQGPRLDDLEWHPITLNHENAEVTLVVDNVYKASVKMHGRGYKLSVQHGLYVGGLGELRVPYIKSSNDHFRGCLEYVVFNEHELLSSLRSYPGLKSVYEVSLGCSDEFFVGEEDPISFFSSKSYIALPSWNVGEGGTWECVLQASTGRGLVLYHSGFEGEFISLEIQDWIVKVYYGKGKDIVQLSSLSRITEDKWHFIKLKITAKHLYLTLDNGTAQMPLTSHTKTLQLNGPLYIGGVDDATRPQVIRLGLSAVSGKFGKGGSFKGCMKSIKTNTVKYGLKNVLSSKDVSPGCKTEIIVTTLPLLKMETLNFSTLGPNIHSTTNSLAVQENNVKEQFIVLNNLVVQEGGRASLQSKHIKLNLDFKKLGLRQSQVTFKIIEHPQHGQLKIEVSSQQEKDTFTMLDLWHGRIIYIHDGSEGAVDHFSFSVSASSKKEIPSYLQGFEQHLFTISVTPTNDAPELALPEGNLFVLLENSKKPLTANLIKVFDVDTEPHSLNLVVLGNLNADAGFLENVKDPGRAVTTFTHEELLEGKIFYVHHGVKNSRLVLRVSDGDKVSNTVVLRILAVPLEYKVVNNTGIEVVQGESALILTNNLAVDTNALNQELDIKYDIIETPKFGQIQRRGTGNEWKPVTSFTQRSLERERVRYLSTFKEIQETDVKDNFRFKVSIANKISEEHIFSVNVQWLKYTVVNNASLTVENGKKTTITSDNLFTAVQGLKIQDKEIFYKLVSLPEKGNIILKNMVLKLDDMFSQVNISNGVVEYQLIDQPHEDSQDYLSYALFTKYAESKLLKFIINIKADLNSIFLTNKVLTISEGDAKLITNAELFVQTLNNKTFNYKVSKSPQHGTLKLINYSDSLVSNDNITAFSSQDILSERLMYVHDDSETVSDTFTVLAYSTVPKNDGLEQSVIPLQTELVFNISVELKNDEKPVRVVDQLFHVVRNGQRLVTLDDLCYHDPDSDFNDGELLYSRRGISNGDLVSFDNPSKKVYQFTQEDLEKKRVLFVHHGSDYGRFVLFVTDGKHYTSSLLEVSASDPYLKIVNNTGLLVQKGKEKILSTANLSIATNMFITSDVDIMYLLLLPPKHGKIYLQNLSVESFTHQDLRNGHVVYKHDDSNNLLDTFTLTVKVESIKVNVDINVRMYLESHQRPPKLLRVDNLLAEEGKPVKIDKLKLQVVHEDNSPSEILFTVITPPSHGYIRTYKSIEGGHLTLEPSSLVTFTQQNINDGNVQYVHTDFGQLQDNFTLDVTNGIREIVGISMFVDIIPIVIPLEVHNFTVMEGASQSLTKGYLRITNKHFAGLNYEFVFTDLPRHGYIKNIRLPGEKLTGFTWKQVEQELIFYVHDDSDTLLDNFTVVVNSTDLSKQSLPQTVFISVTPVNDEPPVITANRIFRVWVGSITVVTSDDLSAEDQDSSPADLLYSITPPSNGHLSLKSSPNRIILNFTQEHINEGQVVFVHSGATSGGFNFQVTDGLNFAPRQIFSITARTMVINLLVNKELGVFPGTQRTISSDMLKAVTNDDDDDKQNRTVTFTVTSPPKRGRLLKFISENMTEEINSFSQKMVDDGLLIYEHTEKATLLWNTQDSFTFTASSPPAALESQLFLITISYEVKDPSRQTSLLANTGSAVEEGGKILIDKSKLDASNLLAKLPESQRTSQEVWYQVTLLPKHGMIIVGDRNITKEKPNFSQYILNKFGITYVHDGSESLKDNFTFAAWVNSKSKSAIKPEANIVEEMYNITVLPVNDQPPELKTKRPHLKVLQGKMIAIETENLNVEDLDNPPEDIKYTIISAPSNGYLADYENLNVSIQHFTQADINTGRVWFAQDGSSSSGAFYFSVTDGKHKPLYKLFNLEVIPVSITIINKTNVILLQGQSYVTIRNAHLAATSDGRSTVINYELVQPPSFGQFVIDSVSVTRFDQTDIELGKLTYHVVNFTEPQDSCELTLFTSESNLTGQVLNFTVEPLLKLTSGIKIPTGTIYVLKTKDLDATELGNLTSSDPQYHLLELPMFGRLLRKHISKKDIYEDTEMFTQSDIETGTIMLKVDANITDMETLNDSFSFLLTAENVPPAKAFFPYLIVPYDPLLVQVVTTKEPLLWSTSYLHMGSASEKKTPPILENSTSTAVPIKTVQRWGSRNRWGNQKNETSFSAEIATTSSFIKATTVRLATIYAKAEPNKASNSLSIILPLVILAVVILAIILLVWFLIVKRKAKKMLPHVRSHSYSIVPQVQSTYTERSPTVPSVTVTPLQKVTENVSVSPLLATRYEHHFPISDPNGTNNQQNSWLHMDPEMIQHCRKTNPTLKTNQYWV
ncbi:chondroitin sulfate proteoglycan 4 [Bombina bombina]|uniref:chondroitin sulfate proteoglycan 4 n=1 Tax=Bombina bombina TaxID=8345 RepID=UPI00235AC940|nr:chondroitin sulfate proteoglycan 4 [Bombina bombina]